MESAEEAVELLEADLRRAEETLTEMKTATQELFDLMQCDPQPVVAIVGECREERWWKLVGDRRLVVHE